MSGEKESSGGGCWCCGGEDRIDIDADKVIRAVSNDELAAPHVFTTVAPSLPRKYEVLDDYGYISATFVSRKRHTTSSTKQYFVNEAVEKERCRSLAIAKLREKASSLGANAVMCLQLDIEEVQYGGTVVIASGSAVVTDPPVEVRTLPHGGLAARPSNTGVRPAMAVGEPASFKMS